MSTVRLGERRLSAGRLESQVAIVTGAGSGIGRAIALALAAEGAAVAVADLAPDRAERVRDEIRAAGGAADAFAADVAVSGQVEHLVGGTLSRHGRIDVLVNNAGICSVRPFLELTEDDVTGMWRVHALGTFLVSRAVARHMVERRYGRIVSIVSGDGGFGASPLTSHYQSAKSAQSSLTRSMALALGPHGITANCISPALVVTPLWEGLDEDYRQAAGRSAREEIDARLADRLSAPLGRASEPEEVAALVVFLALPETATVTGQVIGV